MRPFPVCRVRRTSSPTQRTGRHRQQATSGHKVSKWKGLKKCQLHALQNLTDGRQIPSLAKEKPGLCSSPHREIIRNRPLETHVLIQYRTGTNIPRLPLSSLREMYGDGHHPPSLRGAASVVCPGRQQLPAPSPYLQAAAGRWK